MKKIPHITMLVCGAFALGCTRTEIVLVEPRVAVNLSGELSPAGAQTRGEGMIDPIAPFDDTNTKGLPPKQLEIGIMSIEINSDSPTVANWGNSAYSSYLDRGFFGGNYFGDSPTSLGAAWNGNIEFTNSTGTALQDVFYSPTGEYYHFVCVYPFDDIVGHEDITNSEIQESMRSGAGVTVYFNIDGSGDIMASTGGKGSIETPFGFNHNDNPTDGTVVFSHKLTVLRCKFVAESAMAKTLLGDITSVKLIDQPSVVKLNIGANYLDATTPLEDANPTNTTSYDAVVSANSAGTDDPVGSARVDALTLPDTYTTGDALEFGYMLALPAQTYTFRITTSVHGTNNPLTATYDFTAAAMPAAGTLYNLTFTMLETSEIVLTAAEPSEWWLDQTFD
jgi:hypothetical protein